MQITASEPSRRDAIPPDIRKNARLLVEMAKGRIFAVLFSEKVYNQLIEKAL
jgi:hypothetical protein